MLGRVIPFNLIAEPYPKRKIKLLFKIYWKKVEKGSMANDMADLANIYLPKYSLLIECQRCLFKRHVTLDEILGSDIINLDQQTESPIKELLLNSSKIKSKIE